MQRVVSIARIIEGKGIDGYPPPLGDSGGRRKRRALYATTFML
jgi:hypothetical protein